MPDRALGVNFLSMKLKLQTSTELESVVVEFAGEAIPNKRKIINECGEWSKKLLINNTNVNYRMQDEIIINFNQVLQMILFQTDKAFQVRTMPARAM